MIFHFVDDRIEELLLNFKQKLTMYSLNCNKTHANIM